MQKTNRSLLAVASLCLIVACGTPTTVGPTPAPDAGTEADAGPVGPEIDSITVKVSPEVTCLGRCTEFEVLETRPFVAEVKDKEGNVYTDYAVRWSTGDAAIATVDAAGLATGVSEGDTTVRATVGDVTGELEVFIKPARVAKILVTPEQATLAAGATRAFTASPRDEQDNVLDVAMSWRTSDPRIATVNGSGVVTGVGRGVAVVTASSGFASGWASITVTSDEPLPAGLALSTLALGDTHGCGADDERQAYCWGWNYFGQLGNNTRGSSVDRFPTPMAVVSDLRFTSLALGEYHSCGLTPTGEAACWGSNGTGELGTHATLGEVGGTTVPFPVLGGHTFTRLALGNAHTCALTGEGNAFCWGANHAGQLGKGDQVNAPTPSGVLQDEPYQAIVTGLESTCALTEDGTAACWGSNGSGQLGLGANFKPNERKSQPEAVATSVKFKQLHLNSSHVCAVSTDGDVWCWGLNSYQQTGSGSTLNAVGAPQKVVTDLKFELVTTGAHHSCALTETGRAYCWGNNDNAQLGDGTLTSRPTPVPVLTDLSFVTLDSGANATCGLTTGGRAYCWGSGYFGETGSGAGGDGSLSVMPWPVAPPLP